MEIIGFIHIDAYVKNTVVNRLNKTKIQSEI